jgi:hypothetical protein
MLRKPYPKVKGHRHRVSGDVQGLKGMLAEGCTGNGHSALARKGSGDSRSSHSGDSRLDHRRYSQFHLPPVLFTGLHPGKNRRVGTRGNRVPGGGEGAGAWFELPGAGAPLCPSRFSCSRRGKRSGIRRDVARGTLDHLVMRGGEVKSEMPGRDAETGQLTPCFTRFRGEVTTFFRDATIGPRVLVHRAARMIRLLGGEEGGLRVRGRCTDSTVARNPVTLGSGSASIFSGSL